MDPCLILHIVCYIRSCNGGKRQQAEYMYLLFKRQIFLCNCFYTIKLKQIKTQQNIYIVKVKRSSKLLIIKTEIDI